MVCDNQARSPMQISSARVITEAAPLRQHIIEGCRSKASDIGEALQKAQVVGNNRTHLRLLQHDFRQPYRIRVARVLPRQMVAAMIFLPVDQLCGKRVQIRVPS